MQCLVIQKYISIGMHYADGNMYKPDNKTADHNIVMMILKFYM